MAFLPTKNGGKQGATLRWRQLLGGNRAQANMGKEDAAYPDDHSGKMDQDKNTVHKLSPAPNEWAKI